MTNVKIVAANQANNSYQYRNTKWKVLNSNVNICLINKVLKAVILKYVKKKNICVDGIYFFYIASNITEGKI